MMRCCRVALAISLSIVSARIALREGLDAAEQPLAPSAEKTATTVPARPTVEQARRQAETLHGAMHATLQAVHHRYYKEDEGLPLPAAVLKDVFAEIEKEQQVTLRWLAVEGQAMNSDHKPQTEFEAAAVEALKDGKRVYERTEKETYRRVGAITLTGECLKCHVPNRTSTRNRTAGLIISIPLQGK